MSILNDFSPIMLIPVAVIIIAIIFIVVCFTTMMKNMDSKTAFISICVSIAVICICVAILILPQKPVALLASGEGTGEEQRLYEAHDEDGILRIRVSEDRITVGDESFTDAAGLKSVLQEADTSELSITIVDDYATARAYKDVENVLTELGITWKEETVN